jgi:hypothetical protein
MHTHAFINRKNLTRDTVGVMGPRSVAPGRFCDLERLALLRAPGLGPTVVSRLEAQGLTSLAAMREMGVDRVIDLVCHAMGSPAWKNRHAALARALSSSMLDHQPAPAQTPSQPPRMPKTD